MEEEEEKLKVPRLKRKCREDSESSQAKKGTAWTPSTWTPADRKDTRV